MTDLTDATTTDWGEPLEPHGHLARPAALRAGRPADCPGSTTCAPIRDGEHPARRRSRSCSQMAFDEVEPGRVVFTCTPDASAYNPIGAVHGGLVCTLLDSVCGCALHSTLPAGQGLHLDRDQGQLPQGGARRPAARSPRPARSCKAGSRVGFTEGASPTPPAPSSPRPRAPCWSSTSRNSDGPARVARDPPRSPAAPRSGSHRLPGLPALRRSPRTFAADRPRSCSAPPPGPRRPQAPRPSHDQPFGGFPELSPVVSNMENVMGDGIRCQRFGPKLHKVAIANGRRPTCPACSCKRRLVHIFRPSSGSAGASRPRPSSANSGAIPRPGPGGVHHGMQTNLHSPRRAPRGTCRFPCIPW